MTDYTQPTPNYGGFREEVVEDATLEVLAHLGYATAHGPDIAPDAATPERGSYGDVILRQRLVKAVNRLNPAIPAEARADAIKQLLATVTPSLDAAAIRLRAVFRFAPSRTDSSVASPIKTNSPCVNNRSAITGSRSIMT